MPVIDQMVTIRWSHRSKNNYTVLGVPFTKFGDYFELHIDKVPDAANVDVLIQCNTCGIKVPRKMNSIRNKQSTFCNPSCAGEAKNTSIEFNCEECGKLGEKTITNYNRHPHHFCDNSCSSKFYNRLNQVETRVDCICEQCGEDYTIIKSQHERQGSRFCSVPCRNKWESENKRGLNSHFFKAELMPCTCCGNHNYVQQHKLIQKNHFCNTECRQKWFAEVWSQQDEWKNISRKRAVRILKENKATTNTACQQRVNEMLDKLEINFINEYSCDFYSIDNYLCEHNLMIEVMGDYWHSNPTKYKEIAALNPMQRKRVFKDKSKKTFLLNKYGIKVLYLWENDINNHYDLCAKLIRIYIQSNGTLDDYHSFNYCFDLNQLKIKNEIVKAHFE